MSATEGAWPADRKVALKGTMTAKTVGSKWEHFELVIDLSELKAEGFQGELGRGRIQQVWLVPDAEKVDRVTLSVKRLRAGVSEIDRFVDEVKDAHGKGKK